MRSFRVGGGLVVIDNRLLLDAGMQPMGAAYQFGVYGADRATARIEQQRP